MVFYVIFHLIVPKILFELLNVIMAHYSIHIIIIILYGCIDERIEKVNVI